MKSRFVILTLALAFAILVVLLWLRPRRHESDATSQEEPVHSEATASASTAVSNRPRNDIQAATSASTTSAAAPRDKNGSKEEIRQYMESQNVPIQFYGRVVDQDGNPVSGAHIALSVRHWTVVAPSAFGGDGHSERFEKTTDTSGSFRLEDATGDILTVEDIQKEGYKLSGKILKFLDYSKGATGDPNNPIIYKMWKKGPKESLVEGSKLFGIIPDGRVYTLDLVRGKKVEGEADGDLRVSILRPNGVNSRDRYQWSFIIEGVGGGLLTTDDEFMYLAPESGYKPRFQMELVPSNVTWAPLVKNQFFIRSRNGQVYGHMQVEVNAIYKDHSAIEIGYVVNPNGSRNLEPAD